MARLTPQEQAAEWSAALSVIHMKAVALLSANAALAKDKENLEADLARARDQISGLVLGEEVDARYDEDEGPGVMSDLEASEYRLRMVANRNEEIAKRERDELRVQLANVKAELTRQQVRNNNLHERLDIATEKEGALRATIDGQHEVILRQRKLGDNISRAYCAGNATSCREAIREWGESK